MSLEQNTSLDSQLPEHLDTLKNLLLELPLNFLALVVSRRFSMQVQQRTKIKLRRLEQLDLADMDLWRTLDIFLSLL